LERYYRKKELVGKMVFNSELLKVGDVVDITHFLIVKSVKGKEEIIPFESINDIGEIILLKQYELPATKPSKPKQKREKKEKCPKCGRQNRPKAKYCLSCGNKFT